ncbi:unnamed protein product [Scytosiphon promiscuus]
MCLVRAYGACFLAVCVLSVCSCVVRCCVALSCVRYEVHIICPSESGAKPYAGATPRPRVRIRNHQRVRILCTSFDAHVQSAPCPYSVFVSPLVGSRIDSTISFPWRALC